MCIKITALLAAHNRRESTIKSLENLYRQNGIDQSFALTVVLADDGSTDGTSQEIARLLPQVDIVQGNGNLYWGGGMSLAYERARDDKPDFYLLLNDDTYLYSDAIQRSLCTYIDKSAGGAAEHIVIGSTVTPNSNEISYGGEIRVSRWHPFRYNRLSAKETTQACDTFNGNFVLVHRSVVDKIGFLDNRFTHYFGDIDYGLTAAKAGCGLWVAPGIIGECARNDSNTHWDSSSYSLAKRVRMFFDVKGMPVKETIVFCRKHGGVAWPLFWLMPIFRGLLFPTDYNTKLKNTSD